MLSVFYDNTCSIIDPDLKSGTKGNHMTLRLTSIRILIVGLSAILIGTLAIACSSPEPTPTPVPPTPTPVPPTATPVPPTPTPVPPTATPVPPTPTPEPPTATPEPDDDHDHDDAEDHEHDDAEDGHDHDDAEDDHEHEDGEEDHEHDDETTSSGLSADDAACVEEHSDAETAANVFAAIEALTSGGDAESHHVLTMLAAAEPLAHCGLMPARFAPVVAQIPPEGAECVVEQAGTEILMNFFTITEEQQEQTLNIMALAPLLGTLQACDVALDLSVVQ